MTGVDPAATPPPDGLGGERGSPDSAEIIRQALDTIYAADEGTCSFLLPEERRVAGHEALAALEARLAEAERERDERITRESGQALIADAQRWQRAYEKARDGLVSAKAALRETEYEARQNELYLAMRAVDVMPASEAQTTCIVKLGMRMRLLVAAYGKSEVGRALEAAEGVPAQPAEPDAGAET